MSISVIIPVYNASLFIEKAVSSALNQIETKEIILIEDGSTDESLKVCEKVTKKNSKVKLFTHFDNQNLGPGASRNLGLKMATGQFISFLDADDYFLPNRFETTKKIFSDNPDAIAVYEAVQIFDLRKQTFGDVIFFSSKVPPEKCLEFFLKGDKGFFSIIGLTINREYIKKNNFSFCEKLNLGEDLDFIIKTSLSNKFFQGKLNYPVAVIQKHSFNSTNQSRAKHNKYRHLIFKFWFKEALKNRFPKTLNQIFLRLHLSYLPIVTYQKERGFLFYLFKTFCLIWLLVRYPKVLIRLL